MVSKNKWLILAFAVVCKCLVGQTVSTDEALQIKYKNYKNKFLQHFICLDKGVNGNGLPINSINYFTDGLFGNPNNPGITSNPDYSDATHLGLKKQGDEPEQLALYLGVLSLEYRLLKNEGKDPKPVSADFKSIFL